MQHECYGYPMKIFFFSEAMSATGLTVVEGEFELNTQYHFYMETQSILVRPSEKGQLGTYDYEHQK